MADVNWQPDIFAPVFYGWQDLGPEHGAPSEVRVWYPSLEGNPQDAPVLSPPKGLYPLVLLLHGQCREGHNLRQDHHKDWFWLPAQLARCGYTVAVPDLGSLSYPWADERAMTLVQTMMQWMRIGWTQRNHLMAVPATAIVGHSYGALLGARIAALVPTRVSAYVSLAGPWTEWPSRNGPRPLRTLTVPSLFCWGDEDMLGDLSSLWDEVVAPKHRIVLKGIGHFDHLRSTGSTLRCGNDQPGSCDLGEALTADFTAIFLSKYIPPENSDIPPGYIPDNLQLPREPLTPRQHFYAGKHLNGLNSLPSPQCGVTHSWDTARRTWERTDAPVRFGATIQLGHAATGCGLHSHPSVYGHPGSSGQQQVTCFAGADDNDLWRIKGPDGQPEDFRSGQPVQHGDVVRLEHVPTRRNLHSHTGHPSPVTGQQEVTCFGESGVGDNNDDWRVEVDGGGQWDGGKQIRLIHAPTAVALHSHGGFSHPQWTAGQQEVTGFSGRDANDLWFASDFLARDARFVSQSVPATLVVGQGQDVTVTMRNVGTEPWTPGSQYRLGSQSPPNNQRWGLTRVELPGPIAPGQDVTFAFHVTAPTSPGTAAFRWRMLQEGVEWFGESSPRVDVRVFQETGPTTVPDVEGMARVMAGNEIRAADLVPRFTGAPGTATEVMQQSPAAGTTVNRGTSVTLLMGRLT